MKTIIKLAFILSILFSFAYADKWQDIKVKPDLGTVALTFDDGPSPEYTPAILKILNENHLHAVFFVEGQFAKKYPDLIKQIYADGDVVANHTMHHVMLTKASTKTMQTEINQVNEVVENIIGVQPKCLRPPYGKHNQAVDDYAHSLNMAVLTWDWNSFDYNRPGVQKLTSWVLDHTHNQYVLLLHDGGGDRSQTVAALPAIIKGIEAKGYGFDLICH